MLNPRLRFDQRADRI